MSRRSKRGYKEVVVRLPIYMLPDLEKVVAREWKTTERAILYALATYLDSQR